MGLLFIGISPIRLFSHRSCVSNSIFHLKRLHCKNQLSGQEIQGGSDISGTLSKLHCRIEKHFFLSILLLQTVSAVCRSINTNNNTHSSKVESTGSYKSRDSRWPSRRTYVDGNINNIKENLTEGWGEEVWPPSTPDCNPFDYFVWGVS